MTLLRPDLEGGSDYRYHRWLAFPREGICAIESIVNAPTPGSRGRVPDKRDFFPATGVRDRGRYACLGYAPKLAWASLKRVILDYVSSECAMGDLQDRVVIISGASRGIGRATAIAMAREGAHVAVNYRSHPEEAAEVVAEIERLGRRGVALPCDVADDGAVTEMVAEAQRQLGPVDIAVTNAAYSDRELFYQADMEGFRRTVDVTMWGAFHLMRAATRAMIEAKRPGCIVIVSSPHAFIPTPRAMAYNMSKAALEHMARTAAIEVAEHRIRVNVVQPGWTDTPGERKFASEETLQRAAKGIPWGRLGSPDEIARGIVFLCQPASEYMTGASLLIDGGISLPWWANRGSAAPG